MRIGIDVDGVLTDVQKFELDYGSKFYFESKISMKEIINADEYETIDIFNWGLKMEEEFWNKYLFYYAKNYPSREFASDIIQKLKEDGHTIYIITARSYAAENSFRGKRMRRVLKSWLKKNKIYYDDIIFCEESKLNACIENKIDLMIEDCPNNINMLSKHLKVICYGSNYNEHCKGQNIHRCYSWYNIYEAIKQIEN
jgi:uncharacterized HAD superfamily protein